MGGKAPAFQFYPGDWLRDPELGLASAATQGVWINFLCQMWFARDRGVLSGNLSQLAQLGRCQSDDVVRFLSEAKALKFCDVSEDGSTITVCNRRMVKEQRERRLVADRQARLRERGGGDPERWAAIRVHILERDSYTCGYCGHRAKTVDHIIPKSKGGDESPTNLVSACKRCNFRKGTMSLDECGLQLTVEARERIVPVTALSQVNHNATPNLQSPSPDLQKPEQKENSAAADFQSAPRTNGSSRVAVKLREWAADELWLKQALESQTVFTGEFRERLLKDPDWWGSLYQEINGFDAGFVAQQFAGMERWIRQSPQARAPTLTGVRKFVGGWFKRQGETRRKQARYA